MDIRRYQRLMCVCSLIICVLVVVSNGDRNVECQERSFNGVKRLRVVECIATAGRVFGMKMWEDGETPKSLLNFTTGEEKKCILKSTLGACNYTAELYPSYVSGQVVITDLKEQETRRYRCRVNFAGEGETIPKECYANATMSLGAATTSPSTTVKDSVTSDRTSGTQGQFKEAFLFSNSAVIVILVLFGIILIAVCVFGAIYCRGRIRKQRARDCDALSMRSGMTSRSFYGMSDKGFDHGQRMETLARQYSLSSSAPPKAPPAVPGQIGIVMQYQKPTDCMPYAGTMASVRSNEPPMGSPYHEPWGKTLDDPEILDRLNTVRGNRGALVKIPDFEASSPSYPAPPAAAPTQETGPASFIEERE